MCDTGPLVASVSRRDRHHELCRDWLAGHAQDALVVPVTVAVEVDYLLRARVGAAAARAFLRDVDEGRYVLHAIDAATFRRTLELDQLHADTEVGLVDATVAAVAGSLGADAVLTLDHADLRLLVGDTTIEPGEHEL